MGKKGLLGVDLKKKIELRKNRYKIYEKIKLPSFLINAKNIDFFTLFYDKPNFITNQIITCESIYIENLLEIISRIEDLTQNIY